MKKLLILISIALCSCSDDKTLSEMKSPVRVLAVKKDDYLCVIDSSGRVETLMNSATGRLLSNQFEVGDTIK